jgi:outer membrane protein assembly factor BamB
LIVSKSAGQSPGELKWQITGSSELSTTAVLGTNGLLYTLAFDGRLSARDQTSGQLRWQTNFGGFFGYGSPLLVGPQNRLYVQSSTGFHALDANTGAELWRRFTGGTGAIGPDGTIYLASDYLLAVDPETGATVWEWHGDAIFGTPSLSANGLLFITSPYGKIIAVDTRTGQRVWEFVQDDIAFASVIVAGDGTLLAAGSEGELVALDAATGEFLWEEEWPEQVYGLTIGAQHDVWLAGPTLDGSETLLRVVDLATGESQRELLLPFRIRGGPVLASNGFFYAHSIGRLYAINGTGEIAWQFDPGPVHSINTLSLSPQGVIYLDITDYESGVGFHHRITAVQAGEGLLDSSWPTGLQNPQHTSYWRVSGVPEITKQPQSHWAAFEGNTTFRFYSPVVRPLHTQWYFDGEPIAGATNESFTIPRVHFTNAGNYSVVISNEFGSTTSQQATLSVGYAINLNIVGPGAVVRDPDLAVYPTNTVVTLTAVSHRSFLGWSGDATGSVTTITITLDRNYDLLAAFQYLAGDLKWKSRLGRGPHALGTNGLLYTATGRDSCVAIDTANGRTVWEKFLNGNIEGPPAVGVDGTVYIGTYGTTMWALDGNTGAEKWEFGLGVCIHTCAGFGVDGTLYLAGDKLYAVDSQTGSELWNFPAGDASPAIGADGTVYACGSALFALDGFTGRKKWEFPGAFAPPALGLNGIVYVGRFYANFYAIDGQTGAKLWEFEMICDPFASSVIGLDGTVYVSGADAKVYALDGNTGAKKWEFRTPLFTPTPASTPALTADGTLYVACYDGTFYALDGATGEIKWQLILDRGDWGEGGPCVGPDGTIYIEGHALHATSPLAASAWPKFHRDSANRGHLPAQPVFNPIRSRPAPGGFNLVAHSEPGGLLRIQWSPDLQSWNVLGEFSNPTGTVAVTDNSATNSVRRFYKISSTPP